MTIRRLIAVPLLLAAVAVVAAGCVAALWVPLGPPDDQLEVRGLMPAPGYVWIDGNWAWRSRWVWTPGRWVRPPRANAVWQRGRWQHEQRGWRWQEGRWQ